MAPYVSLRHNSKYTLGKLSPITTVFCPQKHIRIGIRYSELLQGSQVLYPGFFSLCCGSKCLESRVPGPEFRFLGLYFRLCQKKNVRVLKRKTGVELSAIITKFFVSFITCLA